MTEQEQIRAIAELDGWMMFHEEDIDSWHTEWHKGNQNIKTNKLPPYLTSRDAIFPVIAKQPMNIQESVAKWVGCKTDYCAWICCPVSHMAEALLHATGKWKP